jgi:hypothetical protein
MTKRIETIADYWQSQGYSRREALAIERQQIAEAEAEAEQEALYEAGSWNMGCDAPCVGWFGWGNN